MYSYYPSYMEEKRDNKIKKFLSGLAIGLIGFGLGVGVSHDKIKDKNKKIIELEKELNKTIEENQQLNDKLSDMLDAYFNVSDSYKDVTEKYEFCEKNRKNLKKEFYELVRKYERLKTQKKVEFYPTFDEVVEFLKKDKTDKKRYVLNKYDCTQFSWELIRNAMKEGMFASIVELEMKKVYENGSLGGYIGHNIVAFKTRDKGIVYVEPQTDTIMTEDGQTIQIQDDPIIGILTTLDVEKTERLKDGVDYCKVSKSKCIDKKGRYKEIIIEDKNIFECFPKCSGVWKTAQELLENGYFPGIEEIEFENGLGTYLIGFETPDKGKVYYDPLSEKFYNREIHIGDDICKIRNLPSAFCGNSKVAIRESYFDCENEYGLEKCD